MKFKILTWVCVILGTVRVESSIHGEMDTLTLTPDISSFTDPIKSVLWRHGTSKVAELDLDFSPDVRYYGNFKNRTTLDTKTGHLVITDLRTSDAAVYSMEINSKPQKATFDITVIMKVPESKITEKCEIPKTSCTLTCEGDTTGAEPVTYSWKGGEKVLSDTDKTLTVTGVDHQTEMYTCQIKNPVSEKSSPSHKNPFYPVGVPEPKITEKCETPKNSCTLTCEGDTTGAEPVTYSWKGGEKVLSDTDKTLTVTGVDHQTEMYTCQIKNPVSEKSSPSHKNPFYPVGVPEPKITEKCETPKNSCTLTCEGDTTGAEPVTYSWRGGEKVLSDTDKKLTITAVDDKIEMYTCQIKNPVSEKSSPSHKNPFYPDQFPIHAIIVLVVIVFFIVGILIVHRLISGVWFYQKRVWCCLKAFWTKEPVSGEAERNMSLDNNTTNRLMTREPDGANGTNLPAEAGASISISHHRRTLEDSIQHGMRRKGSASIKNNLGDNLNAAVV